MEEKGKGEKPDEEHWYTLDLLPKSHPALKGQATRMGRPFGAIGRACYRWPVPKPRKHFMKGRPIRIDPAFRLGQT